MQNNLHVYKQLKQKRKEIYTMISCIDNMTAQQQIILKSSIILMLYNLVEGIFGELLSSMFDYIIDNNIDFENLHKKTQEVYLVYYLKYIGNKNKRLLEFRKKPNLSDIDYSKFLKSVNLYSGNLDAAKIREISKKFGVTISDNIKGEKLLTVKNIRNKLAHGEVNFSVACRDYTIKEIKDIVRSVSKFMVMCIIDYEKFVSLQLVKK